MSLLIKSATPPDMSRQHWVPGLHPDTYLGDGYSLIPPGATLIAMDGVVVNLPEYLAIRPFGNDSGAATGALRYQHFMGEPQVLAGNPAAVDPIERVYPADNRPFAIEVRHKLFTGNANPAWDGWGWRAEIVGGAASRDPSARAIGLYSDEACTQYLYTTGAFTQQTSAWQVDAQGQPLTVWATEYNPGLLGYDNDAKQDVHHACLLGAAQEGHATLRADQESAYHEFWLHDQGYVAPPAATWVDTGATVTGQAGQLYYISLPAVVAQMVVNEPIRLGTAETVFKGIWADTNNLIQVLPFVQVPTGTTLYRWL